MPVSSSALVPSLLATPQRFMALLAVFFSAHVMVRLVMSPVANLDESEQLVFSQAWQWGYGPQPPLYTWLQIVVFKIFGPSLAGLAVLKNALLFVTYAFTYACGRIVTRTHAGGVLTALSLLFIPQIAWESQRDLTHSVLATTVAAATLFIFLRLQQNRARALYLVLGAAFGLGLLSNYNYALLIAGLLIGGLCAREFRRSILTPWMLVAAAIALAVVLPHVFWARENAALVLSTAHKLRIVPQDPALLAVLRAAMNLAWAWLTHVVSIGLILSVLCWKQLIPFPRGVLARPPVRFLLLVLGSALACVLMTMWATGATAFKGRWLQPIYFCVPILLVALIHERLTGTAVRRVIAAALAVATAVMVALPTRAWVAGRVGRLEELGALFPEITEQTRADAARANVVVADSLFVAGNLRLMFPGKPVVTPQFGEFAPTDGAPLVVFNATFDPRPSADLKRFAAEAGLDLGTAKLRYIDAPAGVNRERGMRLGISAATPSRSAPEPKRTSRRPL